MHMHHAHAMHMPCTMPCTYLVRREDHGLTGHAELVHTESL